MGGKQSTGRTLGEALDGLSTQFDEEDGPTLIVIQSLRPDRFFTANQQDRLKDLMAKWRTARDQDTQLPIEENIELEALLDAEVEAAGKRAASLLHEVGRGR